MDFRTVKEVHEEVILSFHRMQLKKKKKKKYSKPGWQYNALPADSICQIPTVISGRWFAVSMTDGKK